MLTLTMINDNHIALKFTAASHILFLSIIHIQPNIKDLLLGTALLITCTDDMLRASLLHCVSCSSYVAAVTVAKLNCFDETLKV